MMTAPVDFDPNSVARKDSGIFGLPFTTEDAWQVILPVPWEVTVSYGGGTSDGPKAIVEASAQIDLFDPDVENAWKVGLALDQFPHHLKSLNDEQRSLAEQYIHMLEEGKSPADDANMQQLLDQINAACEKMNDWVQQRAAHFLDKGKLVSSIGGDHSTPLGLLRELGKRYEEFGVLHFDAHADLRDAYEGFKYSHASIMFNALEIPSMTKLVQVGVRDYCEAEALLVNDSRGRIHSFYDRKIKERMFEGDTWRAICDDIVALLPTNVYVSFDVDGLDPALCPHTGTPVPGGLEFEQALYLVRHLARNSKRIIGFDINEVAPGDDQLDANIGARLLYRIANLASLTNGLV